MALKMDSIHPCLFSQPRAGSSWPRWAGRLPWPFLATLGETRWWGQVGQLHPVQSLQWGWVGQACPIQYLITARPGGGPFLFRLSLWRSHAKQGWAVGHIPHHSELFFPMLPAGTCSSLWVGAALAGDGSQVHVVSMGTCPQSHWLTRIFPVA